MQAGDVSVREELVAWGKLGEGAIPRMEAVHMKNAAVYGN